jgi:enoyl-CoA hydratase/carnithine racemase
MITSQEALQYGLIEYLFPDEGFLDQVLNIASMIGSYSGLVTAATKKCVNVGLSEGTKAGLALESDLRVKTGRGPDSIEGRAAFLEKRPPIFNK